MSDPVLEALNRAAEERTPEDVERVIAYLRKTRQNHDAGIKTKKETDISLDLAPLKPHFKLDDRRF